uniref:Beta-tubulin n=1 Tax=Ascaris lumbricoides TaxID=6252 RepID=A0A0M3HN68_ASCLU
MSSLVCIGKCDFDISVVFVEARHCCAQDERGRRRSSETVRRLKLEKLLGGHLTRTGNAPLGPEVWVRFVTMHSNLYFGNSGAGNNNAKGLSTEGAELVNYVLEDIRKGYKFLQSFQPVRSLSGGEWVPLADRANGDLNNLVSLKVCGIIAWLPFPSRLNSDLEKLAVNVVPFLRLHFFTRGCTALFDRRIDVYKGRVEITQRVFDARDTMTT